MPQKIISLLDGCPEVNLYYFREYKFAGDIQYLQSIRSGAITEESLIALSYKAMAQFYASRLAAMVGGSYDAIVMAPSSRNDAEPYFEALKQLPRSIVPRGSQELTPRVRVNLQLRLPTCCRPSNTNGKVTKVNSKVS